jgi:hypothetical protein
VMVNCCSISPTILTMYSLGGDMGISELPPLAFYYHEW